MNVDRYGGPDNTGDLFKSSAGDWVLYDDYVDLEKHVRAEQVAYEKLQIKLSSQLDELEAENARLVHENTNLKWASDILTGTDPAAREALDAVGKLAKIRALPTADLTDWRGEPTEFLAKLNTILDRP